MIFAISIHHRPLAAQPPIDLPLPKTLEANPPPVLSAPLIHVNISIGSQGQIRRGADRDLPLISLFLNVFDSLVLFLLSCILQPPPEERPVPIGVHLKDAPLIGY